MAALNVQKTSLAGLSPAYGAADAAGDSFPNDGRTTFHVKNSGTAAQTVTVASPTPSNYGTTHNVTVSVPAGGEVVIGPFDKRRFDNRLGRVGVSYSAVTGVTVAAIGTNIR